VENLGIYALGFLGQALFGARLIFQLIHSEREKRVASPVIFWLLSLGASFVFLIYGVLRHDPVIVIGQTLSYFIYIRNLYLKGVWQKFPTFSQIGLYLLPLISGLLIYIDSPSANLMFDSEIMLHPMMIAGTIGQLALNLRFVYQWYYTEKARESVLPIGFWHISIWASVLVILYALFHPIHGYDPVLLVAQSMGIMVYIRNVVLYRRSRLNKKKLVQ
jgi:lipid-A-disaccharide synthase-like uncharacterized protein